MLAPNDLGTVGEPLILSFLPFWLPDSTFGLRIGIQRYTNELGESKIVIPKPLPENFFQ